MSSATCKVDTRPPSQVTPHQLPQVVAGRLIPEPVTEPARLVSNQNGLIICTHALICYPSKVPASKQPILSYRQARCVLSGMLSG